MRPLQAFPDDDLLELFRQNNVQAYEEIYRRYWSLLYISCCKILKDEDEAKDIVQEVFLSLLNKKLILEIKVSLSNYLYSSVRYKVLDRIKHSKIKDNYFISLSNYAGSGNNLTDGKLIEKEFIHQMEQAIQFLPPKMRVVFELSRDQNLSHKEIARLLDISDKTVKKQINNALRILKIKLVTLFLICLSVQILL